jgi:hypothetical protein
MLVRARTLTVAAMACTALSACSGVVPVKNVETDKLGYLAKSFSLPSVPSAVVGPIRAADDGTLPFQRMTFSMQPVFENISGGNAPPAFHSTWTLINIGGPFVQFLDEQTSNGVQTRQDYGVSYRNLFMVRGQTLLLNRPNSSFVMEAKSLQSFTPVSINGPSQGTLDYRYEWGNQAQLLNFTALSVSCTYGGRYPASRLHPGLLGEAQEVICDHTNRNGVVADHSTRALLSHYGVAILIRNQTAAAVVSFKVQDFSIQ